ncbi:Mannitol-1-phosphate 5-dehydrogenase [Clostridium sp. DL-VIII]|uniref:mannitol-1-phosphate 5-dehydrogenase n=1 Tax=Clostridium sp. DL-VIII TaxID=641107 RepID=UPI00023AFF93|nr:mannitol-1-phosphate 5-dehydrogenase [Clostridium sp. DL-VIII]EHI99112.1 Mannitol-1-phosphate 5-dehydrogenase [Clostridium sp. DL-VIII]
MKKAVHFGAGNIGRGFIGDLLHQSGYEVIFVDVSEDLISSINNTNSYDLYLIDHNYEKRVIDHVSAISSIKNAEEVIQAIVEADIITTSVWANNLSKIAPVLCKGLKERLVAGKEKVNVLACENAMFATDILKEAMKNCGVEITSKELETIAAFPNTAVDRIVLGFEKDGKLGVNIADYFELAVEEPKLCNPKQKPIQGARYTDNLQKYIERKLYVINCGHAYAGYLGYTHGYDSVRDVFINEEFVKQIRCVMMESANLISKKYDFSEDEMDEYVEFGIRRYQAEGVDYSVSMVTRSPIRKLGATDRLVGPCVQCEERDLKNEYLLKGIALVFLLDNEDVEAVEVQKCIKEKGITYAIEHFTGIKQDDRMHTLILQHYYEQKAIQDKLRY